MKTKRGGAFLIISLIFFLIILIMVSYFLFQNLPGEPEKFNVIIKQSRLETANLSYKVNQFRPNMKFNHNSISYKIDSECSEEKKERMIRAFNELSKRVGVINFYLSFDNPDIDVKCSEEVVKSTKKDFFIAGEGGANFVVDTGRYNVILNGTIILHENSKKVIYCNWPNVELHELLHVFGFAHSKDKNSLMYPYLESCEQRLDDSIVEDLKQLYTQKNLPDLYFEEVNGIKKGRYFDFNVTVKNSGTIDAKNVILSVFDDNIKIEDFNLGNIPFGGGMSFKVNNLKLKKRSSENIKIIIDYADSIKEIEEENNIAELNLPFNSQ